MQAGQWSGKADNPVGQQWISKRRVFSIAAIGVDQQVLHLGGQAAGNVPDQRLSRAELQSLVDTTHACTESAGKDDAGDEFISFR